LEEKHMTKRVTLFAGLFVLLVFASGAWAIMGGGPGMGPGTGAMMGNTGGFGMMNGMAGAPVVSDDGTAYLVSHNPGAAPGPVPGSASFQSTIRQVKPTGQIDTLDLEGIVSRPVVSAGMLVATASLPNMGNFNLLGNLGNAPANSQSTLYAVQLPFTSASVPVAVSLDGSYASVPVIADNHIYVVTTDFGNAMLSGNTMFAGMYGGYNFNLPTARSYLYIVDFSGNLTAKIQLQ